MDTKKALSLILLISFLLQGNAFGMSKFKNILSNFSKLSKNVLGRFKSLKKRKAKNCLCRETKSKSYTYNGKYFEGPIYKSTGRWNKEEPMFSNGFYDHHFKEMTKFGEDSKYMAYYSQQLECFLSVVATKKYLGEDINSEKFRYVSRENVEEWEVVRKMNDVYKKWGDDPKVKKGSEKLLWLEDEFIKEGRPLLASTFEVRQGAHLEYSLRKNFFATLGI